MEIIKIAGVSIVCAVISLILKQIRPEIVPFAEIASIIVIVAMIVERLKSLLEMLNELVGSIGIINEGYILLLVKVLGVAVITKLASDICRDCGNSALGTNVELAGKVIILVMSFTLIKTIAELAKGLLG